MNINENESLNAGLDENDIVKETLKTDETLITLKENERLLNQSSLLSNHLSTLKQFGFVNKSFALEALDIKNDLSLENVNSFTEVATKVNYESTVLGLESAIISIHEEANNNFFTIEDAVGKKFDDLKDYSPIGIINYFQEVFAPNEDDYKLNDIDLSDIVKDINLADDGLVDRYVKYLISTNSVESFISIFEYFNKEFIGINKDIGGQGVLGIKVKELNEALVKGDEATVLELLPTNVNYDKSILDAFKLVSNIAVEGVSETTLTTFLNNLVSYFSNNEINRILNQYKEYIDCFYGAGYYLINNSQEVVDTGNFSIETKDLILQTKLEEQALISKISYFIKISTDILHRLTRIRIKCI